MDPKAKKIIEDIKNLKIQGARNIARSALDAVVLQAKKSKAKNVKDLLKELKEVRKGLEKARATEPMLRNFMVILFNEIEKENERDRIVKLVEKTSEKIKKDVGNAMEKLVTIGSRKIPKNGNVLVHCHSSTLIKILIKAKKSGKKFHVYSTETRPRYQGRLTAADLAKAKIPVTQIVDSAVGTIMPKVDMVLVGCDAITAEGAVVNKIGTKVMAMVAKYYGKPFYVAGETYKIDPITRMGFLEKIEERNPGELGFKKAGVKIFNPAFDVTNPKLIHGIITEKGIIPPSQIFDYAPTKA
jgi:ribose 1,5-bisphosphate isomerase